MVHLGSISMNSQSMFLNVGHQSQQLDVCIAYVCIHMHYMTLSDWRKNRCLKCVSKHRPHALNRSPQLAKYIPSLSWAHSEHVLMKVKCDTFQLKLGLFVVCILVNPDRPHFELAYSQSLSISQILLVVSSQRIVHVWMTYCEIANQYFHQRIIGRLAVFMKISWTKKTISTQKYRKCILQTVFIRNLLTTFHYVNRGLTHIHFQTSIMISYTILRYY